jgi:hypothetical protein
MGGLGAADTCARSAVSIAALRSSVANLTIAQTCAGIGLRPQNGSSWPVEALYLLPPPCSRRPFQRGWACRRLGLLSRTCLAPIVAFCAPRVAVRRGSREGSAALRRCPDGRTERALRKVTQLVVATRRRPWTSTTIAGCASAGCGSDNNGTCHSRHWPRVTRSRLDQIADSARCRQRINRGAARAIRAWAT